MLEVIIDTDTTGLSTAKNHRIVEIGCVELNNQIPTKNIFHEYINPQRTVSEEAYKIHGYSEQFLSDKKTFAEIEKNFLDFLKDKIIIIHNAPFDLSFLNYELKLINKKEINKKNVVDTLEIARQKYPGSQNSLDALCKRFNIDNSKRVKHNALDDCYLLREVYINLVEQKEPKLNLENTEIIYSSRMINNTEILDYLDQDLLIFSSNLYDQDNNLTNNITDAYSMENFSLSAYQDRFKYYDVLIPNDVQNDIVVSARFLFRPFKPDFILEHHSEFINNLPIFEISSIVKTITLE